VTAILILAWAFGLVAIVAVGRYITSLGEDIDAPRAAHAVSRTVRRGGAVAGTGAAFGGATGVCGAGTMTAIIAIGAMGLVLACLPAAAAPAQGAEGVL
jgi:hypothetical protein